MEETNSLFNQVGATVTIIVVVVVILLILRGTISARRKRVARHEFLINRGYTPVDPSPPELIQGLEKMYLKANVHSIQVHDAFSRPIPNGMVDLFDLMDTGGSESDWIGKDILAVISPDLQLPRIMIQPLPDVLPQGKGAGLVSEVVESAIDWGASLSGYQRVRFPNHPNFDDRRIVIARDQAEASDFLSDIRVAQLSGLTRPYHIETNQDMFTIHEEERLQQRRGEMLGMEEKYSNLLADAQKLFHWFQQG
jgi:hypothetical protein